MTQVIEIAARAVGEQPRRGEVLETLGDPRSPHYRIRWEDGHESVFYPPADLAVQPERDPAATHTQTVQRLVALLRAAGIPFEVIPHGRTTSAAAEARALFVRPEAVGKTVVVRAAGRRFRAVVGAASRLDLRKLAAVAGAQPALLTEAELGESFPEYDLGAVPPFGDGDDCVIVDSALANEPSVIVEAGSHECSLRLAPRDLIIIANAQVADIGEPAARQ